jgi:hypothetical protein
MIGPEDIARERIDTALVAARWLITDVREFARAAALRESTLRDASSVNLVLEIQSDKKASALLDHIRQKRSA